MSSKEVLQLAGAELDRLTQQLVHGDSTAAQPLKTIETLIERLVPVRQELCSHDEAAELQVILQKILTQAKRVQMLLESGTAFHCHSIFGRPETPDTYSSDGTFSASHDFRIIFQG